MLVGRPHSTVHQILRRGGCSRREPSERPGVVRYEWPCPGNLAIDRHKNFAALIERAQARANRYDRPLKADRP